MRARTLKNEHGARQTPLLIDISIPYSRPMMFIYTPTAARSSPAFLGLAVVEEDGGLRT